MHKTHTFTLVRCWGGCSAAEVQRLSLKAFNDQASLLNKLQLPHEHVPFSLRVLAHLGCSGKRPGNVASELKGWLGQSSYPSPLVVPVTMAISKPQSWRPMVQKVAFPIMVPHFVVSHLFNNHRRTFDYKLLGIGEGDLTDKLHFFWTEVVRRKDPRIIRHPMSERERWTRRAIPIAFHGDAVPVIAVGRSNT